MEAWFLDLIIRSCYFKKSILVLGNYCQKEAFPQNTYCISELCSVGFFCAVICFDFFPCQFLGLLLTLDIKFLSVEIRKKTKHCYQANC